MKQQTVLTGLLVTGSIAVSSSVFAQDTFSQQQTRVYLENLCTTAAYPNDSSDDHSWTIKRVVDGKEVLGFIVEDGGPKRCLMSVDSSGFITALQVSKSEAPAATDNAEPADDAQAASAPQPGKLKAKKQAKVEIPPQS